jgi:hypothetical protein
VHRQGRPHTGADRTDPERGAAALETVGVTVVAVSLVVAVVLAMSPMGPIAYQRLCAAFVSLTGGGSCGGAPPVAGGDRAPTRACTLSADGRVVNGGIGLLFVDLGTSGSYLVEEMSDRTYQVSVDGDTFLGASLTAVEAELSIEIGDSTVPTEEIKPEDINLDVGVEVDASAALVAGMGSTYAFASREDAEAFTDHVRRSLITQGSRPGARQGGEMNVPWSTSALAWMAEGLQAGWDVATGYDYTPPAPTSTYVEGRIEGGGEASAGGFVGDASAGATVSNAIGYRLHHATGEVTVYTRVTLDAEAQANLGMGASAGTLAVEAGGAGGVELMVAVTKGGDGTLTAVELSGVASQEHAIGLTSMFTEPLEGAGSVHVSAQFPVTDANRKQVTQALIGMGALGAATGTGAASAASIPLIVDEARATGDITAQFFTDESSNVFDVEVGVNVPGFGWVAVDAGEATSGSTSTKAFYLDREWKEWSACA